MWDINTYFKKDKIPQEFPDHTALNGYWPMGIYGVKHNWSTALNSPTLWTLTSYYVGLTAPCAFLVPKTEIHVWNPKIRLREKSFINCELRHWAAQMMPALFSTLVRLLPGEGNIPNRVPDIVRHYWTSLEQQKQVSHELQGRTQLPLALERFRKDSCRSALMVRTFFKNDLIDSSKSNQLPKE